MKLSLVPNVGQAWRWLSIRFIALAAVWEGLPYDAKAVIPLEWQGWITFALLILAGLGRVVDQGTTPPTQQADDGAAFSSEDVDDFGGRSPPMIKVSTPPPPGK